MLTWNCLDLPVTALSRPILENWGPTNRSRVTQSPVFASWSGLLACCNARGERKAVDPRNSSMLGKRTARMRRGSRRMSGQEWGLQHMRLLSSGFVACTIRGTVGDYQILCEYH
eukprot:2150105-Rhodomonas_salina.1